MFLWPPLPWTPWRNGPMVFLWRQCSRATKLSSPCWTDTSKPPPKTVSFLNHGRSSERNENCVIDFRQRWQQLGSDFFSVEQKWQRLQPSADQAAQEIQTTHDGINDSCHCLRNIYKIYYLKINFNFYVEIVL